MENLNNETNYHCRYVEPGSRGRDPIIDPVTGTQFYGDRGTDYVYKTKLDCLKTLVQKMAQYAPTRDEVYIYGHNYTTVFNSWLMASYYSFSVCTAKDYPYKRCRDKRSDVLRRIQWTTTEGLIEVDSSVTSSSSKTANNQACFEIFKKIQKSYEQEMRKPVAAKKLNQMQKALLPQVQMEKETEQGLTTQESDRQRNTIITMDQEQAIANPVFTLDNLSANTSSELCHTFPSITERWMPLKTLSISIDKKYNDTIDIIYLPEGLYSAAGSAPNLAPFSAFIYGRMSIEVKAVVNSNKFSCGKIVMSSKYDSNNCDTIQNGCQSALNRNHVILDLATNNEGLLDIPFRFHRPWMRLVKNDKSTLAVRSAKYCSVYLHVLSPLQTGSSGPSEIGMRLFYRFKEATFTGMSFRVQVQGLGLEDIVSAPTCKALKEILVGAERAFDQLGKSRNQDKPGLVEGNIVVPRPRLSFGAGKGIIDVQTLRVNPHTLTNYKDINLPQDEPKDFYQLARIWGIYGSTTWKKEDKSGDTIATFLIDPTSRHYSKDYGGEITPLEYACANYAFWSGTIEMRFDFVSNSYHTGSLQISAEFGRVTASETEAESSSTYTKVFHLGDQKSVSFRVPYIYDTVMRRTTDLLIDPYRDTATSDYLKTSNITIAPESNTFVKLRIINPLRPIISAPQQIEILTFIRAGPDFIMHGLKGFSLTAPITNTPMNEFPFGGYVPIVGEDKKKVEARNSGKYSAMHRSSEESNEFGEYHAARLPKVQMDNGEKEDQDTTENFLPGISNALVQTLDSHMSFKDLLRRPCLIMSDLKITPKKYVPYYIPLMPPSRNLSYINGSTFQSNGPFANPLKENSSTAIMNLFRLWRGSMRYTIVISKGKQPVYVSLIPHSGVRLIGTHDLGVDGDYPVYGANFTTEIIIPPLNPTACIEAPYDTENTWTYSFEEDPNVNYSWRDKGDTNSGHIAITVKEETTMDVWWSAGDDFEITNFYGIPNVKQHGWAYRWGDNRKIQNPSTATKSLPQTQMDFNFGDIGTSVDYVKQCFNPRNVLRAGVMSIPYVGTGLVAGQAIDDAKKLANTTISDMKTNVDKLTYLAANLSCDITSISDAIKLAIKDFGNVLGSLTNGVAICTDFILDLLVAWMEKSWKIVAVGILRFFIKMIPSCIVDIWKLIALYAQPLTDYIVSLMSTLPVVQAPPDAPSTIVGLLLGVIGTIFGVTLDHRRHRSFPVAIFERLTTSTGISYLLNVLRFVQGIFISLKDLVMEALGYVSPEAVALKKLSESNEIINSFIKEAQIMTSESNASCLNSARYRRRFWKTVLSAHQIQRLMCEVPTNCVSAQLSRLCTDVIKLSNEKFMDISASPVRFEPMVICIDGTPGIGKSYATEEIVERLLKKVGFSQPSSEHIYYRVAGEKFWSGYRDQPVVVYDEWLNVNDPTRCTDMITEMMKLKSTSIFIPEMAHLDEKKIRGNPYLVIMLCNNAFPTISDYARCPEAVFRRRDIVLNCERVQKYQGVNLREVDPDELREFGHLEFKIYPDPTKPKVAQSTRTFNQTMEFLENRFVRYWAREKLEVKKRLDKLPEFAAAMAVGSIRLEDPFSLFYELNHRIQTDEELGQNGWTPYEQLEVAINSVTNAIESYQQTNTVEVEVPDKMEWKDIIEPSSTQGWWSFTAGFLLEGRVLAKIARASLEQLTAWENSINPLKPVLSECCVCQDQVECVYVCGETVNREGKHFICLTCRQGCIASGHIDCPVCRCSEILPYVDREDICTLSLWSQLAMRCNLGLQWLCNKYLSWYGWRQRRPTTTAIIDFLLCVAAMYTQLRVNPKSTPHYNIGNFVAAHGLTLGSQVVDEVMLQSDDWDDALEITGSQQGTTTEINEDAFTPDINVEQFEKCLKTTNNDQVCLHHQLLEKGVCAKLERDIWIMTDLETNQRISVSMFPCKSEQCPIHDQGRYRLLLESCLNRNKRQLRGLYITYFNSPTDDNLYAIPKVYWAKWMTDYKEQPLGSWWTYLTGVWTEYKDLLVCIAGVTGVLYGLVKIYSFATSFSGVTTTQFGGSVYAGDTTRHQRARVERSERRYFEVQSTSEPSLPFDVAQRYIVKNLVKFTLQCNTKCKNMYGVGIFGHYVLIPRHYAMEIRKHYVFGNLWVEPYARPHEKHTLNLDLSTLIESKTDDIAYLRLPASCQQFKDIRKFMCTEADLKQPLPNCGILMAVPSKGFEYVREVMTEIIEISPSQVVVDQDENMFEVRDVLVYNYSKPGACGSIMLREHHTRPILSMHFAGIGEGLQGEGYGVLLTQEALGILVQIEDEPKQMEDRLFGSLEDAKLVFDETVNLHYLGSVPKELTPYIPTQSQLVRSRIFGAEGLETILEPAILDRNDPRYLFKSTPLYEGVKKHGILTSDFLEADLKAVKEMLMLGWIGNMKPSICKPKVLTIEQAIVGFPELTYYRALDLNTSAGYPYTLTEKKKKLDYVTPIRNEQQQIIGISEIDPMLRRHLDEKEKLRREGIVPITIFTDTLKDEKRKREKARKLGGTRVFCSSPFDYSIECRRYFMHFIAAFMEQRMSLMHGVGINPTSSEWGQLVTRLLAKNHRFITIDYSNFGPGYNAGVAEMAYEIMVDWTMENVSGADRRYLRTIVWECIQSTHIAGNTVYQQHAGSPSGAVFTTIINTIVNQLYILLAWKSIMGAIAREEKRGLVQMFKDEVCLFTYGDDLIMTVTPKYLSFFNTITITDYFKQYNIVATSADKTAEIKESLDLSEATFLKRGFKPHPTRPYEWLSPLEWQSIIGATQWVWKSVDSKGSTLVNCNAALLQAHGHGTERYRIFQRLVNRALKKQGIQITSLTWEEIDELYFSDGLQYITDQLINQI